MSIPPDRHDPAAIFDALARHRVDYVTVGGLAVGFWANPRATKDTDIIVAADDAANDERLAAALRELAAELLPLEAPGARVLGIRWELEAHVQRYLTSGGVLDVMRDVEGARPYPELRERAARASLFGTSAVIVGREDLIAMKLAAGRGQDVVDLEALLDPRNLEAGRVAQRALDRELLRVPDEPAELGEPTDPCEREVDAIRRVLAPVGARAFNNALAREARRLRDAPAAQVDELVRRPIPQLPASLEQVAAQAATARVEQLQATAEQGVEQLRAELAAIEQWWNQNGRHAAEGIAARRESYRRDREAVSERVRAAPERRAPYIAQAIGERPTDPTARERWDAAARSIEAYAAREEHQPEHGIEPPSSPDRAARGAWERMQRAIGAAGIEPPSPERGRSPGLDLER